MSLFDERKALSVETARRLVAQLRAELGADYGSVIGEHSCVHAIGSCGRGEMGSASDLDAYVVRVEGEVDAALGERIGQAFIRANDACELPPVDGGGRFLEVVSAEHLCDRLGSQEDDGDSQLLTKRMLLLLESRPLVGEAAYARLLRQVVNTYWRNSELHPDDYLPLVLVNDIVRYWRIVLLNHESKLSKRQRQLRERADLNDAERRAELLGLRRYGSYKLRFARCITCFSALTYLLALTQEEPGNVSKAQVLEMIASTPIERLKALASLAGRPLPQVDEMLELYAGYLRETDAPKAEVVARLVRDDLFQRQLADAGERFTQLVFELVQELGGGRPLHRHMVV